MANNNRTEAQSAINSALVPTLTLAQLKALHNNELTSSFAFDKDVIGSQAPTGGTIVIDYSNKDTATVTTASNLSVSFTGMQNGMVKYLVITKQATNTVTFSGALDVVQNRNIINTLLTSVCYRISNKNGTIYVEGLYAPTSTSFTTTPLVPADWIGSVNYRINNFTNQVEIEINNLIPITATQGHIATLPSGYEPDRTIAFTLNTLLFSASKVRMCDAAILDDGRIFVNTYNLDPSIDYYASIKYFRTLP